MASLFKVGITKHFERETPGHRFQPQIQPALEVVTRGIPTLLIPRGCYLLKSAHTKLAKYAIQPFRQFLGQNGGQVLFELNFVARFEIFSSFSIS